MFHSRPELASTLKHIPHQASCLSGGPRDSPATWFSSLSGLHLLRLPTPHPGFGSITLSRGRAQASRERKRRRKPKGGARLWSRSSPSPVTHPDSPRPGQRGASPPFTFIKRLFSSSSLSAIRVVSSAYLRLLLFLLAILIPACASSSPPFSHDVLCIEVK